MSSRLSAMLVSCCRACHQQPPCYACATTGLIRQRISHAEADDLPVLQDAALQNNFSRPDKRTLMAGLAIASIV